MPARVPRRAKWSVFLGVCVLLLGAGGLHVWWNTNLFGPDAFCGGLVSGGTARAALNGPGRIAAVGEDVHQARSQQPDFTCTLTRTSRLTGVEDTEVTFRTHAEPGDFPFQTAAWKRPSRMSPLPGSAGTGAVDEHHGWMLLPEACWGLVPSHSKAQSPKVPTVQAEADQGALDREGLASALVGAAERVATTAHCSEGNPSMPNGLQTSPGERQTSRSAVCGLNGFALPQRAFRQAGLQHRTETSVRSNQYWACDLDLTPGQRTVNPQEAYLTFTATDRAALTGAIAGGSVTTEPLPKDAGRDAGNGVLLRCGGRDVYFGAKEGSTADSLLHEPPASDTDTLERELLQRFLDAAAPTYSCPKVTLPRG